MTITVSAAFDGGNIEPVSIEGDRVVLRIAVDRQSDFYQWFHFRVLGARGRTIAIEIENAAGAAYPDGWPGYRACWSDDRETWRRVPDTRYDDGRLHITHAVAGDSVWFAYFAPYSSERHLDLVARIGARPGVSARSLGRTLDGREIDCLTIAGGKKQMWLFARQHPGETMAEWWAEGALEMLTDPGDPIARSLRARATFHVVPNLNPDGAARGHLRTNAVGTNLNREWHAPSAERSPEIVAILAAMDATGVDFAIDAHGDEAIPHVFLAGFEGIPSLATAQAEGFARYSAALAQRSPDFQTRRGYATAKPGTANLSMSTNQIAERFGCVAMTLEMPFKDNDDLPDPAFGWSPARSKHLAHACLAALHDIIDTL